MGKKKAFEEAKKEYDKKMEELRKEYDRVVQTMQVTESSINIHLLANTLRAIDDERLQEQRKEYPQSDYETLCKEKKEGTEWLVQNLDAEMKSTYALRRLRIKQDFDKQLEELQDLGKQLYDSGNKQELKTLRVKFMQFQVVFNPKFSKKEMELEMKSDKVPGQLSADNNGKFQEESKEQMKSDKVPGQLKVIQQETTSDTQNQVLPSQEINPIKQEAPQMPQGDNAPQQMPDTQNIVASHELGLIGDNHPEDNKHDDA